MPREYLIKARKLIFYFTGCDGLDCQISRIVLSKQTLLNTNFSRDSFLRGVMPHVIADKFQRGYLAKLGYFEKQLPLQVTRIDIL